MNTTIPLEPTFEPGAPLPLDPIEAAPTKVSPRIVIATVIGNGLEFFDFTVFSFFAVMIGHQFFPSKSPYDELLLSVATFGVGFLTRPLGSFVIGAFADRAGRKKAMTLTILMMALGTGMLGLVPPFVSIGYAAPCLVVLARLIQGFSAGGEMGAATAYLLEVAPPGKRGVYASWQGASQGGAAIAGGLIGYLVSISVSAEALQSWGWRIPFILGIAIAPIGMYIRNHLPETAEHPLHENSRAVLSALFARHRHFLILAVFMVAGATITQYIVGSYMTSYALTVLHLPASTAMLTGLLAGIMSLLGSLFGGWLSDRVGRKPVILLPRLALLAAAYPAFLLINRTGSGSALLPMVGLLMVLNATSFGAMLALITESFPQAVRTSGVSISYAISTTLFGSTTQFVATWLQKYTGDPVSPSWYLIAGNSLTIAAVLLVHEGRERRRGDT